MSKMGNSQRRPPDARPSFDGDPTPFRWVDMPTLRLLPGEKEKFEKEARGG